MSKRMLADVLWDAANDALSATGKGYSREEFSCHAAMRAEFGSFWRATKPDGLDGSAIDFLVELGCDPNVAAFEEARTGRRRQGVRYMWLLLAMHVAEDERIAI